jgi:hypothetical protein
VDYTSAHQLGRFWLLFWLHHWNWFKSSLNNAYNQIGGYDEIAIEIYNGSPASIN